MITETLVLQLLFERVEGYIFECITAYKFLMMEDGIQYNNLNIDLQIQLCQRF